MPIPPRSAGTVALCACLAVGLAGCYTGDTGHASQGQAPAPTKVTAAISDSRIDVSPRRFGAGAVLLVIANRSSGAQEVTFEDGGGGKGLRQTTSAINPHGTAHLPVDLRQGTYEVSVGDTNIRPASLTVGP
jgi:hypothetical protein